MCGRMQVDEGLDDLYEELLGEPYPGETNHNVAPTEPVWIVRNRSPRAPQPGLEAVEAQWWLTPFWSKVPKPRYATFNAKAETLHKSSTFREPFQQRRCVVPITGFYEWQRRGEARQPFHVRPVDGPLLLAGVLGSLAQPRSHASHRQLFGNHHRGELWAVVSAHAPARRC